MYGPLHLCISSTKNKVFLGTFQFIIFLPLLDMCGVLPVLTFSKFNTNIGSIPTSFNSLSHEGITALGHNTATGRFKRNAKWAATTVLPVPTELESSVFLLSCRRDSKNSATFD